MYFNKQLCNLSNDYKICLLRSINLVLRLVKNYKYHEVIHIVELSLDRN
jgi:hypothetical protein